METAPFRWVSLRDYISRKNFGIVWYEFTGYADFSCSVVGVEIGRSSSHCKPSGAKQRMRKPVPLGLISIHACGSIRTMISAQGSTAPSLKQWSRSMPIIRFDTRMPIPLYFAYALTAVVKSVKVAGLLTLALFPSLYYMGPWFAFYLQFHTANSRTRHCILHSLECYQNPFKYSFLDISATLLFKGQMIF